MRGLILAATLALVSGCKSNEIYAWGSYEDGLVEVMVEHAGGEAQAEALSRELQETEAAGRRAPPGLYAHLGYLLANTGDLAGARQAFKIEQRLYPESSHLMDRLISRVEGPKVAPTPPVETSTISEPGGRR